MMNLKVVGTLVGAAVVAFGSTVITVVNTIRTNNTIKALDDAIDKVATATNEKVTDAIVNKAIEKAADKHIDEYMCKTEIDVLKTAEKNLSIQAKNAVDACAKDLRKQAADKVSKQVEELDIEELKARVCDQAEAHVVKKLDVVLDNSAKKFQDQLDSTKRVFDGIQKAMLDKEEKDNGVFIRF